MSNFVDSSNLAVILSKIKSWAEGKFLTQHQDISGKVDKVSGKGLSTNDFTTALKNKLDGIATGAEVNVQANWNQTDTSADDYIKNKPTLFSGNYNDLTNKPTIPTIPSLSKGTTSGSGNAVTDISVSGHTVTLTKGATFLTQHQDISGKENISNKVTSISSSSTDAQYPSAKAVYSAISNGIAAADALIYKGTIGTSGTVTALPTTHKVGWTYRVTTAGTYAGQNCEVGDLITAIVARSGSGNANSDWTVVQTNIQAFDTSISSNSMNAPTTKAVYEFAENNGVVIFMNTSTPGGTADKSPASVFRNDVNLTSNNAGNILVIIDFINRNTAANPTITYNGKKCLLYGVDNARTAEATQFYKRCIFVHGGISTDGQPMLYLLNNNTATTSVYGLTKLSSVISVSEGFAATPKAVKTAYDLANSKQSPATTLAGYGISDAKISNGVITLGGNTITPITQQSLAGYVQKTQTINGKALSSNITLTAADVGAIATGGATNDSALTAAHIKSAFVTAGYYTESNYPS